MNRPTPRPIPRLSTGWPASLAQSANDMLSELESIVEAARRLAAPVGVREYGHPVTVHRDVETDIDRMMAELDYRPAAIRALQTGKNEWLYELAREVAYHARYDNKAARRLRAVPSKVLELAGVLHVVAQPLPQPGAEAPVEVLPLQLTRREWAVVVGELNVARDSKSTRSVRHRLLESAIKKMSERVVVVDD